MLTYKEVLAKTIKKSGLSLRTIAERCSALQVSVSASYLSQLQTGKLLPPSEEVSRVIAQVCGGNANDLILLGYIDRAPEIVKEYFFAMSNLNKDMFKALNGKYQFKQNSKEIEQMDEIQRLFSSISVFEKFKRAANLKTDLDYYEIAHGEAFIKYEETSRVEFEFMVDDSMEPLIPENSLLKLEFYKRVSNKEEKEKRSEPENGDVVQAIYYDKEREVKVVRRYQKSNNIILLIPENKKYDVITIDQKKDNVLFEKLLLFQKALT